ncbi:MAG: CrcB family protein [Gloeomargarita sp. HHBFW_bins_162]
MSWTVLRSPVAIALAAVAGALSRYYVSLGVNHLVEHLWEPVHHLLGMGLPLSTLVVNVTGCGVMGFAATLCFHPQLQVHPDVRLMLLTGFMSSYTTFSSYELDSARLFAHQQWGTDFLYWAGSGIVGWLCLEGGSWLAHQVHQKFISSRP